MASWNTEVDKIMAREKKRREKAAARQARERQLETQARITAQVTVNQLRASLSQLFNGRAMQINAAPAGTDTQITIRRSNQTGWYEGIDVIVTTNKIRVQNNRSGAKKDFRISPRGVKLALRTVAGQAAKINLL